MDLSTVLDLAELRRQKLWVGGCWMSREEAEARLPESGYTLEPFGVVRAGALFVAAGEVEPYGGLHVLLNGRECARIA